MARLRIDLNTIVDEGRKIEEALTLVVEEAVRERIALIEIYSDKGDGELKKRVMRFLAQPQIKVLYHRVIREDKNFGRVFVRFRHKNCNAYH